MGFSESFLQKHKQSLSRYTLCGFLESFTRSKVTHDSMNWSHPDYNYRVRLVSKNEEQTKKDPFENLKTKRTLETVTGSKTKAHKFHACLEGDYELATDGLYTNNFQGLKQIYQAFPDMFESVQTHEQFLLSHKLSKDLIQN